MDGTTVESFLRLVTKAIAKTILVALLVTHAHAQGVNPAYPTKPIRMIVPLAAGGAMDATARGVGQKLTDYLGQAIVVDNQGGAGGAVGAQLAAQAAPDGYTLIMVSANSVIHPLMYPARFDTSRDFAAVSQITTQPHVIVVNPGLPTGSVAELISYAKANPGKLNYASSGNGSLLHLMVEVFKQAAGIDIVHIPYKGMAAAYPDLFAGNTQLTFASIISAIPHIKAQRLRAIAVTSGQRAKALPGIPTVAESGVPGYAVTQWYGVLAPARTPQPIVGRLNRELIKVLQQPEVLARLAADGAEPVGSTPEQFTGHIKAERDKWARVIRQAGIRRE
jgi:tripartite-type tricarboxylate transporter receptor subunit TctC